MLSRSSTPDKLRTWAFLVGVELDDSVVTPEQASNALQDALRWKDGIGAVLCDDLGEVAHYEPE